MKTFKENQKFTQPLFFLILFSVFSLFMYALINQIFLNKPFGNKPMPNVMLILVTLIPLVLIVLLYTIRLNTHIDDKSILIQFIPFIKRKINLDEIESMEVIKYQFVGYGLRTSFKYGQIYNINGDIGLAINLKNGKKVLLGTQKEAELKSFLKGNN